MEVGILGGLASPRLGVVLPVLGCFGGGSLYGWSGLMPAVQDAFSVGSAAASMVFSFALASFTMGVLLSPLLLGRIPSRLRLVAIALVAAESLALSCLAPNFAIFVAAYGVGFGFSSGALYSYAIARASTSESPNLWVPVSVAAFGLGGVIFGPANIWLTELGWSLRSVVPALACLVIVAAAALFGSAGQSDEGTKSQADMQFVWPDRIVLNLWAIFAAGSFAGLIVLGLASTFLMEDAGSKAAAVFAVAAGNTIGRLSAAFVASRFGPAPGIMGALSLSVLALAGLALAGISGVVIALLFLVALSYGQVASQTPLLVSRYVPAPSFASSFGWVFTGWGVAGLLGPWGAGWLLERSGDLRIALFGCIALCLLGLFLTKRLSATGARSA